MLITVEDNENRARAKLQRAVSDVKKLLVPMVSCGWHVRSLSGGDLMSECADESVSWRWSGARHRLSAHVVDLLLTSGGSVSRLSCEWLMKTDVQWIGLDSRQQ